MYYRSFIVCGPSRRHENIYWNGFATLTDTQNVKANSEGDLRTMIDLQMDKFIDAYFQQRGTFPQE